MGNSFVYAVKIALIASITLAFATALNALIALIQSFVLSSSSAIGEVLTLISLYLPFNAGTVFSGLIASMSSILTFLVAKKVYELVINAQGNA